MFAWDLTVVVAFVVMGRSTHAEPLDFWRSFRTAEPFLLGLALGWFPPLVWRTPLRIVAGLVVGLITVAAGLAIRRVVFAEGISGVFPVVTTGFIVGLMVLGRLIAQQWQSRRR